MKKNKTINKNEVTVNGIVYVMDTEISLEKLLISAFNEGVCEEAAKDFNLYVKKFGTKKIVNFKKFMKEAALHDDWLEFLEANNFIKVKYPDLKIGDTVVINNDEYIYSRLDCQNFNFMVNLKTGAAGNHICKSPGENYLSEENFCELFNIDNNIIDVKYTIFKILSTKQ